METRNYFWCIEKYVCCLLLIRQFSAFEALDEFALKFDIVEFYKICQ